MAKKHKMVIVMRTDLGMGVGKMIAQAGHAVVQRYKDHLGGNGDLSILREWRDTGMKKVCVGTDSEISLLHIVAKAQDLGIPVQIIRDAGLTQNEPGTYTCCAIGPDKDKLIEKVTGSLKLL